MKYSQYDLDQDLEHCVPPGQQEPFAKIRNKKEIMKGRQSVSQLVSREPDPADPDAKFEDPDLNELCRLGYLDELIAGIKTGKEASVYLGRNYMGYVAVKVYTDLRVRAFKRDEAYREGRRIGSFRVEKAINQRSRHGMQFQQELWVQEEIQQMKLLAQHGVPVPRPIAVQGKALVMEFIGGEDGSPAPRISALKMDADEAQEAFRQSVHNLKLIVETGRVHGDYSTYNILWQDGSAVVIDFPQVIEFMFNRQAPRFLERDVHSLCKSFLKQGVQADEAKILSEVRTHIREGK